ncbi:glycosyltransferase family 2 protein [Corynebacterium sp. TAE3-ERU12]|uniref:glycosyltransferase family 2 protein n=1 Tax=Corynebacterium sp. TAE3-ERU12 TaxID=2849491 RepID=UPI001C4895F5|nr:glycosyltransferase family 2 protein [Corynebacterium sp. TAE3-ERU12]MBV7295640.1 glycosyltransferase family 2 protein [Corynebacterium sp. TAE3-ERU12]
MSAIDVVVCVHDPARLRLIRKCLHALVAELQPDDEVIVVTDHSPQLHQALRTEPVTLTANTGNPGLSDARNTGVSAGQNPIICFIDDDAVPRPGWAQAIRGAFANPTVTGIGGAVYPRFDRPARFLPAEHHWVIGCDYAGMPGAGAPLRNPIGAAMAVRRSALEAAGPFATGFGRVGGNAGGAEETDLFMRIRAADASARIIRVPAFAVDHAVPRSRTTWRYYLRRSFAEGRAKAQLLSAAHADAGAENDHLASTIPRALCAHLRSGPVGWVRAARSLGVVAATGAGYVTGRAGSPHSPAPSCAVSVVLCTDNRADTLPAAVAAILSNEGDFELVVVDNSAAGDLSFTDPRVRVVRAPVRGLSRARNVGISAARGRIIAFTDDDTIVAPDWVAQLCGGFGAADDIVCVTGRTVAFDTSTEIHRWFEEAVGFDKGTTARVWRLGDRDVPPLYPFPAGCFGSGNNMAFRAEVFAELGGFAEELGAGRGTRGGEDLDMFRRIILAGGAIGYVPAACARHHHRDTFPALKDQMFGYGAGMAAALTRCAVDDPRYGLRILIGIPDGVLQLFRMRGTKSGYPPELLRTELRGFLAGGPLLLAIRIKDAVSALRSENS